MKVIQAFALERRDRKREIYKKKKKRYRVKEKGTLKMEKI